MQCCCIIFIKDNKHLSHNNCTLSDFMILSSMLLSYFVHDFKVLDHFSTIECVFYVEPACHCQVVVVVISKSEEDVVTGSIKVDARDVCQTEIRVCMCVRVCVCVCLGRKKLWFWVKRWLVIYVRSQIIPERLVHSPSPLLLIKTSLHHFNERVLFVKHTNSNKSVFFLTYWLFINTTKPVTAIHSIRITSVTLAW